MRALNRLLLADLARLWRQGLAIVGLLACGIATFMMSTTTMRALDLSRERYYQEFRFADLFVHLTRAPSVLLTRLSAVDGVQIATGRIVRDVLLDLPEMREPVSCRMVSLEDKPSQALNDVFLRSGRLPVVTDRVEVIASELFAEAHGLRPGDRIRVNLGGKLEDLSIVGIGLSPEFIYVVQPGLLLSDDRRYGVLWALQESLAPAFSMEGAFNNAVLKLAPDANFDEVRHTVDRLTLPYGGTGAYGREDQESHERVSDEMHQVRAMAILSPSIFLFVTLFLLHIVFSRLVHQQRESIATLRAFGYTPWEIGGQYVRLVLVWVGLGTGIGLLVGIRVSRWMGNLYMMFFRFPYLETPFWSWEWVMAIGIALGVGIAGSILAIRDAMRLPPAVSMRPEPPKIRFGVHPLLAWVRKPTPVTKMVVRRLQANPWITVLSVLGLSLGLAIVILSSFMEDAIDYVLENQFGKSQRQDLMLTFRETRSESAWQDVSHLPGVLATEPFRSVPVRMRNGVREQRMALMGLESSPQLFRILDDRERSLTLEDGGGLVVTGKLAELLHVKEGDAIDVDLLEGQGKTLSVPVRRIFPNFSGPAAYMNRTQLHRLLEEGERISGVFVKLDRSQIDAAYAEIKETPDIIGVLDKQEALKNFRTIVSQSTFWMRWINAIFAALIALGVTYNSALVAFTERARELATMRVMGFSQRELAAILLSELAIITALAIPVGIPISYAFCFLTTLAIDTESHRFPLVVDRSTMAYGVLVLLVSVAISSLAVVRLLKRLDMLSVLKVTE